MIKNVKFKFIISLFLAILSIEILMPFTGFAIDTSYLQPDQFDDSSYNNATSFQIGNQTTGGVIKKFLGVILTLVRSLALGWAILMAMSIAIKYMSGDAQIKAQLKTDMPTYLWGALILFGASGIITIIQYFIEDTLVV